MQKIIIVVIIPNNDGNCCRAKIVPRFVLGSPSNSTQKNAITIPLGIPCSSPIKLKLFQKIWPATPAAINKETPLPMPHPF